MSQTILTIEDEKDIRELLGFHLSKAGFESLFSSNGEQGLELAVKRKPSLIILDLMLPGLDGIEVCRRLKKNEQTKTIPVVMLTARHEETDKIVGFELGIEDYITKPFSPRELVLRIKTVLRRTMVSEFLPVSFQFGNLEADFSKPLVLFKKKKIDLTAGELKLLQYLFANRGRVQSRETLLDRVWGYNSAINTRTVDAHVKRLREKMGQGGYLIETVRGMGYRFSDEP